MLPQPRGRRSSTDIIADILRLLRLGEAGKTEIMYKTNMSHSQRERYLKKLLELGLASGLRKGHRSVSYRVTQKGLKVLGTIEHMQEMLLGDETVDVLGAPELTTTARQYKPKVGPSEVKKS